MIDPITASYDWHMADPMSCFVNLAKSAAERFEDVLLILGRSIKLSQRRKRICLESGPFLLIGCFKGNSCVHVCVFNKCFCEVNVALNSDNADIARRGLKDTCT